jgi:hypothetical protein
MLMLVSPSLEFPHRRPPANLRLVGTPIADSGASAWQAPWPPALEIEMLARGPFGVTTDHLIQSHIRWHRALFHLELGQHEVALALHDGPMRDMHAAMAELG